MIGDNPPTQTTSIFDLPTAASDGGSRTQPLFTGIGARATIDTEAPSAPDWRDARQPGGVLDPTPTESLFEVLDRAYNPDDAMELRDLYLARLESELSGGHSTAPGSGVEWAHRRRLRRSTQDDVLCRRSVIRAVKELYNSFFRDQLYGQFRSPANLILSSGSPDETRFGLPRTLIACLHHSLARGWYGYSDSRGRIATRAAIAELENARLPGRPYTIDSIAITLGATLSISSLADFILADVNLSGDPSLCAIPNYPPMIESISRRAAVRLVPLKCGPVSTSLRPLIDALTPNTPLVLLQTVTNPTGTAVDEADLDELIARASPSTMILLDESHECTGREPLRSPRRARSNVVRIISLSKTMSTPGLKLGWIVATPPLIADFYEYVSSTYGGPPSLYYLLLEVLARMERWMLEAVAEPTGAHVAEFEAAYGLVESDVAHAYRMYVRDRVTRDSAIVDQRQLAGRCIKGVGVAAVDPSHSINMTFQPPECRGSFRWFREALAATQVSTYPGLLTFDLGDRWLRLTVGRDPVVLETALDRLSRFLMS